MAAKRMKCRRPLSRIAGILLVGLVVVTGGCAIFHCHHSGAEQHGESSASTRLSTTLTSWLSFVNSKAGLERENHAAHLPKEEAAALFVVDDDVVLSSTTERTLLRKSNIREQQSQQQLQQGERRLPADFAAMMSDPGLGGIIIIVVIALILLFCCRGCLCDLLACVCLYEICCDDAAIGGFDMMM